MRESLYQRKLIKRIKKDLPGCVVLKNDPNYIQGFPDLLVLNGDRWAALEVKKSEDAEHQPNQDYWVDILNGMSYAAFVFPENERKIRDEVYSTLRTGGNPCVSQSEPECVDELHGRETGAEVLLSKGSGAGNEAARIRLRSHLAQQNSAKK